MTRAKGKAQKKLERSNATITMSGGCKALWELREPGEAKGIINLDEMTGAEVAKHLGTREHIIYEMFMFSQYADGSVYNCQPTTINPWTTLTAQEVVDHTNLINVVKMQHDYGQGKVAKLIEGDLKRNAKAALKNGMTKNLAPRV